MCSFHFWKRISKLYRLNGNLSGADCLVNVRGNNQGLRGGLELELEVRTGLGMGRVWAIVIASETNRCQLELRSGVIALDGFSRC